MFSSCQWGGMCSFMRKYKHFFKNKWSHRSLLRQMTTFKQVKVFPGGSKIKNTPEIQETQI